MLIDILTPFLVETGYDAIKQRALALNWINRAAKEIYDNLEADDGLWEVVLAVPADKQITLPSYVSELRGLRQYKYSTTIPLHSIGSPRYTSDTWQFMWRNWTQKGHSPIHTSLNNAGVLTITSPVADGNRIVINMQTATTGRLVEEITMNAVSRTTTHSPIKIHSISSPSSGRQYDYTIKDINGTEIAVLENRETKTEYRVIDVSEFQWASDFSSDPNVALVEVLYKPKLYPFYNDTDEFTAPGYDDAIHYKAMEFWFYGQEGKEQDAIMFNRKAAQAMNIATRNQESGEVKQLLFQPNPVYRQFELLRRYPYSHCPNPNSWSGGFPYIP